MACPNHAVALAMPWNSRWNRRLPQHDGYWVFRAERASCGPVAHLCQESGHLETRSVWHMVAVVGEW